MSSDPTPPRQPPPGSGSEPPPPEAGLGSGSGRRPSSRAGYPPVALGLLRSSSQGALQAGPAQDGGAGSPMVRASSSASLRGRPNSREQLEPLASSPPVPLEASGSPRSRPGSGGPPRLAPLAASPSRPGSGASRSASLPQLSGRSTARAAGVPPLALSGGRASPSASPGSSPGGSPPPPLVASDATAAALAARRAATEDAANATTARGPIKWVPHTHSNPKHAKFCFICLHGRLEGQVEGVDAQVKKQAAEDQDLPSPVDLKELGYLMPSGGKFQRTLADFDKDNVTAMWLRGVSGRVYEESIRGMVAEQNYQISKGVDVKLVNHEEDAKDREVLARLFELSAEEQALVKAKLETLGEWCASQEAELLDVLPPQEREEQKLPEVPNPTPLELKLQEYTALVDLSSLKGESAADARDAMRQAEAAIASRSGASGFSGFRVEDLPRPETFPDMPAVEVKPYPLTVKDLPVYEPMEPSHPERFPIDAISDPFQRPFLHMEHFHETVMPEFEGTAGYGKPRPVPAQAAEMEWLCTTQSMFCEGLTDEPEEGEEGTFGWGAVPLRGRIMPPLIDEPYLPEDEIVISEEGKKKLLTRGIWDPELVSQDGRMMPPLRDRGRSLYTPITYEHPDEPLWSRSLAPPKTREDKIKAMIPLLPVRSFAKFKPCRVSIDLPDFLWDLVRQDAAGQGLWDVVEQRHQILREVLREREAADEELQRARDAEREAVERAMEAEAEMVAALPGPPHADVTLFPGGAGAEATPPARMVSPGRRSSSPERGREPPASSALASTAPAVAARDHEALPAIEVEAPEAPALPRAPAAIRAAGAAAAASAAAAAESGIVALALRSGGSSPQSVLRHRATGASVDAGETRKVEELLSDERFIDTIADRIAQRIGGTGVPAALMTQGDNWRETLGRGAGTIMRPDPPLFLEPADERSRAELPRALAGGRAGRDQQQQQMAARRGAEATTVSSVQHFTQEKMRGECYVRLLVAPEANSARQGVVPYRGDMKEPDSSLVTGGGKEYAAQMPKKPPAGDDEDDDDYADFERNDAVIFSFVRHNRFEAVESLISQDPDVLMSRDEAGNSLLHVACQNNNRRIVKLLIRNGISVNEQNARGNTPLHYCSQYGFMQLADYLLANGGDETIPNDAGLLPPQGLGAASDDITGAQKTLQADLRGPG